MGGGVAALRSWNSSVVLGIDACERAHYALRLQLRSPVGARNATTSANTAFLQEVATDHQQRHKCWPFQSLTAVTGVVVPAETTIVLAAPTGRGAPPVRSGLQSLVLRSNVDRESGAQGNNVRSVLNQLLALLFCSRLESVLSPVRSGCAGRRPRFVCSGCAGRPRTMQCKVPTNVNAS